MRREYKNTGLPKGFRIGEKPTVGIQTSGNVNFKTSESIFLECRYPNRDKCHDTIAIIPNLGKSIDSISDEKASEIFQNNGWLVKGFNSKKYTRCPYCKLKIHP